MRGGLEQYLKMIEPPSLVTSNGETKMTESLMGVASHVDEGKVPSASLSSHHLRSVSEVSEEEEEHTERAMVGRGWVSHKSSVSRGLESDIVYADALCGIV